MKNKEQNKIILFGLLEKCPFEIEKDCILHEIRQMEKEKRISWAKSLSNEEINEMIDQHERCFWKRMDQE